MIRFFDSRGDYTLKNGNVRALRGSLSVILFSTRGVGHAGSSHRRSKLRQRLTSNLSFHRPVEQKFNTNKNRHAFEELYPTIMRDIMDEAIHQKMNQDSYMENCLEQLLA